MRRAFGTENSALSERPGPTRMWRPLFGRRTTLHPMRCFSLFGIFVSFGITACAASPASVKSQTPETHVTVEKPLENSVDEAQSKKKEPEKEASLEKKEALLESGTSVNEEDSDSASLGLTGAGPGGGSTGAVGIGSIGHGAGTGTGQGYGSGAGGLGGGGGGGRSKVSAATASTSGSGLPPEVIRRLILSRMGGIRACYDNAILKDPNIAGKLAVKFTINAQGAVSSAQAVDTTIANAEMVSCVVGVVRRISFPQPDGGETVVVTYPLQFSQAAP